MHLSTYREQYPDSHPNVVRGSPLLCVTGEAAR